MRTRIAISIMGSSPHTRGARSWLPPVPLGRGIIPAYAGCTPWCDRWRTIRRDHPRIRGVHAILYSAQDDYPGSSPHTRGAPCRSSVRSGHGRIIPAYAGCTYPSHRAGCAHTDHPRIRGVHHPLTTVPTIGAGSSPHTRGALDETTGGNSPSRIIPAYAGCTSPSYPHYALTEDHPRIRGVHSGTLPVPPMSLGSSPHTRGALGREVSLMARKRIIPAYAGCTENGATVRSGWTDHPRIRGVHCVMPTLSANCQGSSPHTRGAQECSSP